jgi:O-antigen ligase
MKAATGPNRPVWILLSTVIIAMMMVSGTRTNLVLLAAAIGIVGSAAKGRVPIYRLVIQMAFLLLLAGVSIPVLGKLLTDDPQFLSKRISAAAAVMTGKFATDGSFLERAQAYATAKAVFLQSPLVGVGPGHAFTGGLSHSHYSTSLDTPWLVPAKLGLLGVAALIFYLASVLVCMARIRRGAGGMEILTVGRGWFAILLFLTPFGPWVEDRGFALALALFVAALSASARESFRGKRDEVPPRPPSLAVSTGDVAQVT